MIKRELMGTEREGRSKQREERKTLYCVKVDRTKTERVTQLADFIAEVIALTSSMECKDSVLVTPPQSIEHMVTEVLE